MQVLPPSPWKMGCEDVCMRVVIVREKIRWPTDAVVSFSVTGPFRPIKLGFQDMLTRERSVVKQNKTMIGLVRMV